MPRLLASLIVLSLAIAHSARASRRWRRRARHGGAGGAAPDGLYAPRSASGRRGQRERSWCKTLRRGMLSAKRK